MLIDWLKEKQATDGINDAEFARKLRISRSYWTMFKNGTRQRPTYFLLESAIQAYPDEREHLLSFLGHSVTVGTSHDTLRNRQAVA